MGIKQLAKPQGAWCAHCVRGKGCGIYPDRPEECRVFHCEWLVNESLGPEWKPDKAKFVLVHRPDRIVAHVDPATPAIWRRPPYQQGLAAAVKKALARNQLVYVAVNQHYTLLLPDREVDLGELHAEDQVALKTIRTPRGLDYQVEVQRH
jgi:hypothetical protein